MTDDEKLIWEIKHLSSGTARDKLVRKYYDPIYAYVYRHVSSKGLVYGICDA